MLSIDGLTKADVAFNDQVDNDGKPIAIMPAIILVPTALNAIGTQLDKSLKIRDNTANAKGPIANAKATTSRIFMYGDPNMDSEQIVYREGHDIDAALARGKHQAVELARQCWDELADQGFPEDAGWPRLPLWATEAAEPKEALVAASLPRPPPVPRHIGSPVRCSICSALLSLHPTHTERTNNRFETSAEDGMNRNRSPLASSMNKVPQLGHSHALGILKRLQAMHASSLSRGVGPDISIAWSTRPENSS